MSKSKIEPIAADEVKELGGMFVKRERTSDDFIFEKMKYLEKELDRYHNENAMLYTQIRALTNELSRLYGKIYDLENGTGECS